MKGVSVLVLFYTVCLSKFAFCTYYEDELFTEDEHIHSIFDIEVENAKSEPREHIVLVTRDRGGFLYPVPEKEIDKDLSVFETQEDNGIHPQEVTIEVLSNKLDSLISQVKTQQDKIVELEKTNKKLQDKIDLVEQQTKTNSAIFFNIRESKHESHTATLQKILHVINRMMKVRLSANDIAVALRADSNFTQDRPIVVRFTNFVTKMKVLGATNTLRHSNIIVVGDYSEQVAKKRSELLPYMYEARRQGLSSFLLYDKLVVDGVKMTLEQLQVHGTLEANQQQIPETTQDPKEQVEEVEVDPEFQDHDYEE